MQAYKHKRGISIRNFFLFVGFIVIVLVPMLAFAQGQPSAGFVPLANLPGITPQTGHLGEYLNKIYLLLIALGAIFAAIRISLAGAQYAFSEVITDKNQAREAIKGVLIGLAILLLPYVVLRTINPNLLNLDVLRLDPGLQLQQAPGAGTTNPPLPAMFDPCSRQSSVWSSSYTCQQHCEAQNGRYLTTPEPGCQYGPG